MKFKKATITIVILAIVSWASFHLLCFALGDIHASLGKMRLAAGDYPAARAHLASSIRYADSNPDYHYAYAEMLYAQAKKAQSLASALDLLLQAKKAYEKAIELNPREGNQWLGLAQACWWLSRFKGHERDAKTVESLFLKTVNIDPNNGKFLYSLANYYLSTGESEKVFSQVERLAEVYPASYRYLHKYPAWSEAMEEHFRQGLEAAASNPLIGQDALSLLSFIASEGKDWVKAATYTQMLIQRIGSRTSPGQHFSLAHYYLKADMPGKAKNAFCQGLELSDNRGSSLASLFYSLKQDGAFDLFIELCRETAKFDQGVRNNLDLILGKAYALNNSQERAIQYLRQSIERRETAEAHYYLAEIAMKQKDWDAAEIESQRATVLDPQNDGYSYLFARTLQAQKKYGPAVEAISRAIQHTNPPKDSYFSFRASLYWSMKDYKAAASDWKTAQKLAPQNVSYPWQIARACSILEDFASAEYYYLAALKLKPQEQRLHQELEAVRKQQTASSEHRRSAP